MKNKMHGKKSILLVIRWPVGGIRTFIRYVYRNFEPSKWRFTIVALDLKEMAVLLDDLSCLEVVYVPVEDVSNDGSSGFWRLFRRVTTLLLNGNYDLVHSHGFTSGMCVALPAFFLGLPHLMTLHDTLNEKQFAGVKGRSRRLGMAALFSLIDKVQSVSNDAQENLLTYFPGLARREQKYLVIPSGIEVRRFFEARPRDLRSELGVGKDFFLIGFFGRFMSQKGFRFLVDAVELLRMKDGLPKRPFVLAFGEGAFIREEKQAIEERGLKNYFCFMPCTPNIADTIKGLDVVAMPSLWEACGLLAMEVLTCGTPLIGSDCIGLREVIKGTPAIVVSKADAADLGRALLQEMEKSSKETFLRYCLTAAKIFDVRKTSQSIMNLYEQMTNSNN